MREGHPMMWALQDPLPEGRLEVHFPYVENQGALVWDDDGTYVEDRPPRSQHAVTHQLEPRLGRDRHRTAGGRGWRSPSLVEHDSAPWDAFPGWTEELPGGEHRLRDRPWRLPHTYTISATKPS